MTLWGFARSIDKQSNWYGMPWSGIGVMGHVHHYHAPLYIACVRGKVDVMYMSFQHLSKDCGNHLQAILYVLGE